MNICIFGSGAIGSYIGALLMKNGIKVSLICRGEHLKAIQSKGLLMQSAETNTEYFCKPIACLLYTSPSPRDMRRSRMPSSA